jgi:hypothetical protein
MFCVIFFRPPQGGAVSEEEKDKVVYFPGKAGFYKKGPGEFKLDLGNLDDLIEEAEPDGPEDPEDSA